MRQLLAIVAVASACCLAGCSSEEIMLAHSVKLVPETKTIPQNQLLDVGVVVFDPGVPDGKVAPEVKEKLVRAGTFVQVRRAEAMYMAVDLRNTLQNSGHWGSVWVTPQATTAADLNVQAKILLSDGDVVKLHVNAVDATGRKWIDKDYQFETAAGAYNKQRYPTLDPYQDVFNEIANDLSAYQSKLPGSEAEEVRRVAALRYADDLSPEAFAGYVDKKKDGSFELERLPASTDPVFVRTEQVRQREDVFMDTLNQHYTKFANDASDPYRGWRQSSREEAITIHELQKSARWRTGLGIASILASVAYGGSGNGTFQDRLVQDALMYMGTDVLKTAAVRRQEKRMHTESLQELSSSFNDEVQPLVVDIKGTQHRLTGTVEAQYQEWRDLLHQLFVSETGFVPSDLQVYQVPAPDAAAPAPDAAAKAPDGKAGDQSASAVNGGAAAKSSGDSSSAASGNGSAAPGAAKGGSAVASPAAHASSVSTGSAAKGTAPGASTAAGSAAPAADAQTGSGSAPSKADAGAKANAGATADAEAGGAG